ncbi:MAG: polysaccharide pyruvyl transferase family protein [Pseudomonadota bacterium]|nr:polysaccharide pyruvyl transferase family protein [Pseudomonadota bacterium]
MFNDTRGYGHYGCDLVMSRLTSLLEHRAIKPVYFWPVRKDWRPHAARIPAFPDIHAVIVNGEGSIHRPTSRKRAVYLSELGRFANESLGVPAFLVNATIHDIDAATADNLRAFERVFVRESGSLRTLERNGIPAAVAPDLCMSLEWNPPPVARAGVLGTDSVFEEVSRRVRSLCRAKGWAFVRMEHKGRLLRRELLRLRHMRSCWEHWFNQRERVFLDEVRSSEFVITGRFHAMVFCLLTRTPFLAIESNTPKISAMLLDVFGNTDRLVALDDLKARVENGPRGFDEGEIAAIDAYVSTGSERVRSMIESVADSIHRGR